MKYNKVDDKIFVSIDKGELVNQSLLNVAEKEGLNSGWLNGLGAISNIEIGYWDILFPLKIYKNLQLLKMKQSKDQI